MFDGQIVAGKEANLGFQLIGMARIFGEHQNGPVDTGCELRRRQRCACADQAAPAGRSAGLRYDTRVGDQ